MTLLWTVLVAFLVATTLLLVLRPVAVVVGLLDHPSGHKQHVGPVPVIGGVAMLGGLVVAYGSDGALGAHGLMLLLTAAFVVVLGMVDDRYTLTPSVRLVGQLLVAMLLIYTTGFQVHDLGNLLGTGPWLLGDFSWLFTVLAILALINAFNMLDGLDGLAGGAAVCAFTGLLLLALAQDVVRVLVVCSAMVGALLAFLMFNVPTRYNRSVRTFMGDAGSTLLGFLLAAVALTLVQPSTGSIPPAAILWVMPIPIFELFTSTVRRLWQRKSPLAADNGHFHHRLQQAGFSERAVFLVYFAFSASSVVVATAASACSLPAAVMFIGFLGLFALWLAGMRAVPWLGANLPAGLRGEPQR